VPEPQEEPVPVLSGCGHIIIHRLIAGVIDQLGIRDRTIGIAPVGCAVFAYDYFDFDMLEVAHGRPPAAATGMKRMLPDRIVFSYQGDGDLASIGPPRSSMRQPGENFSVFFVNNATYGMTGRQMAPTTLLGQVTATTPGAGTAGPRATRCAWRRCLPRLTAFADRQDRGRFTRSREEHPGPHRAVLPLPDGGQRVQHGRDIVRMPTNWKMTPAQATIWLRENMLDVFRLGTFKDETQAHVPADRGCPWKNASS